MSGGVTHLYVSIGHPNHTVATVCRVVAWNRLVCHVAWGCVRARAACVPWFQPPNPDACPLSSPPPFLFLLSLFLLPDLLHQHLHGPVHPHLCPARLCQPPGEAHPPPASADHIHERACCTHVHGAAPPPPPLCHCQMQLGLLVQWQRRLLQCSLYMLAQYGVFISSSACQCLLQPTQRLSLILNTAACSVCFCCRCWWPRCPLCTPT